MDYRTFYDDQYKTQGKELVEWLRYCSANKVKSIQQCTAAVSVNDVLEVGCGTGALLEEMSRVGFGENYWALDLSSEAIQFVNSLPIPQLHMAVQGNANDIGRLFNRRFDLVILSHVIEHVPEPKALLNGSFLNADHVFIEVPLEGTIGLNLKWRLLGLLGKRRVDNVSGHVHFFSKRSFEDLLANVGVCILASRRYVPMDDQFLKLTKKGTLKRWFMLLLFTILGERVWGAFWYSHYAVLVVRTPGCK